MHVSDARQSTYTASGNTARKWTESYCKERRNDGNGVTPSGFVYHFLCDIARNNINLTEFHWQYAERADHRPANRFLWQPWLQHNFHRDKMPKKQPKNVNQSVECYHLWTPRNDNKNFSFYLLVEGLLPFHDAFQRRRTSTRTSLRLTWRCIDCRFQTLGGRKIKSFFLWLEFPPGWSVDDFFGFGFHVENDAAREGSVRENGQGFESRPAKRSGKVHVARDRFVGDWKWEEATGTGTSHDDADHSEHRCRSIHRQQ